MKPLLTVLLSLSLVAIVTLPVGARAETPSPAPQGSGAPTAPVDSLQLLEKAVAKDSTQFDNLFRLGILYVDHERSTEAVKVLTKAHRLRPADHRVNVNLGVALDALGRQGPAQAYYREALKAFPRDSVAACRLASSLYSQKRTNEAVDELRRIIQDMPQAYCAYFLMGVAFAEAEMYGDAVRMWQKVLELAPTSQEAVSVRENIEVLKKLVP